jgi:hypothetical protein
MLRHLVYMANDFLLGSEKENAIIDLAIVAFWGMARLGELTYGTAEGHLEREFSVMAKDVEIVRTPIGRTAIITIRNTKTASPGVTQRLQLHSMKNMLCPVEAVERRLANACGLHTSLFGYFEGGERHHLMKTATIDMIQSKLREGGFEGLLGHSFRVGGASLRAALGKPIPDICELGQWTSSCYKLYLREYSVHELQESKWIVKELTDMWRKEEDYDMDSD